MRYRPKRNRRHTIQFKILNRRIIDYESGHQTYAIIALRIGHVEHFPHENPTKITTFLKNRKSSNARMIKMRHPKCQSSHLHAVIITNIIIVYFFV